MTEKRGERHGGVADPLTPSDELKANLRLSRMQEQLAKLPAKMCEAPRWLVYKVVSKDGGKAKKVPFYTNGNARGSTDKPEDIARLDTMQNALLVYANGAGCAGLGFALGSDGAGGNWQGIDLDNLDSHPELMAAASDLPSYVEHSPSGNGLHAIGYGPPFRNIGSNGTGVEAYSSGRFFTVTGEVVRSGEFGDIGDYVERVLRPLHASKGGSQEVSDSLRGLPHVRIPRPEEAESALRRLRAMGFAVHLLDARRWDEHGPWFEEWFTVCHHEMQGSAEGLELCLSISRLFANCEEDDIRYRWDSLGKRDGPLRAIGTLRRVVNGLLDQRGMASAVGTSGGGNAQRAVMLGDFVNDAGPVSFLWRGLIPAGAVGSLLGQPNSGKSAVALAIAMALASGQDTLLGVKLEHHGAVLYIVAEGVAGMKNRMRAFAEDKLRADPAALPVVVLPGATDLNDPLTMDALAVETRAALAAWASARGLEAPPPVRLVIVDTKARNTGDAEENSSRDQASVLNNCTALQLALNADEPPTVLMLTHPPHAEMRERGSTAAPAGYDFRLELHVTNQQAGGGATAAEGLDDLLDISVPVGAVRKLTVAKQRDGTTELGLHLRFVQARPTWMRRGEGESDTVVMLDLAPVVSNGSSSTRADEESLGVLAAERKATQVRSAKRRDNDGLLIQVLRAVQEAEQNRDQFDRKATAERIPIGHTKMDNIISRAKDEKLLRVEGTRGPYKLTARGKEKIRSTGRD